MKSAMRLSCLSSQSRSVNVKSKTRHASCKLPASRAIISPMMARRGGVACLSSGTDNNSATTVEKKPGVMDSVYNDIFTRSGNEVRFSLPLQNPESLMIGSRKCTKCINLFSIKINSSAYHYYRRLAIWKKTALVKVTFLLMSQPSLTSLTITQNLAAPVEESLPQLRLLRPWR